MALSDQFDTSALSARFVGVKQTWPGQAKIDAIGPIADARRLLLRSAFKQPVAELLRHETLRPLPCLVIVAAECEELLEHDALGCCIDGSSLRGLAGHEPCRVHGRSRRAAPWMAHWASLASCCG